jgi:hypothetical protein
MFSFHPFGISKNARWKAAGRGLFAGAMLLVSSAGVMAQGTVSTVPVPPASPAKPGAGSVPARAAASKTSNGNPALLASEAGPQMAPAPTLPDESGGGTVPTSAAEATTSMPLKISLTPSETPLKIGSTSNIAATIQNISSKPVRVELNTLQLTTHSIVASSTSLCVLAMTPNYNFYMNPEVVLQPQDQVSVLFNLSQGARFGASSEEIADDLAAKQDAAAKAKQDQQTRMIKAVQSSCNAGWLGPVKRALDFSPGNYDYFLTGYFSLCLQATDTACKLPMRPISLSATFPVGIDQTSIIIFAIVGGWLALLVVTFNEPNKKLSVFYQFAAVPATGSGLRSFWERLMSLSGFQIVGGFLIRVFGVAILSAAFTIVSSRLSDTQLPVKISILDAWGAMTIGFVSFFIGQKFITALANWGGSGSKKTGFGTTPPAAAAAVVVPAVVAPGPAAPVPVRPAAAGHAAATAAAHAATPVAAPVMTDHAEDGGGDI